MMAVVIEIWGEIKEGEVWKKNAESGLLLRKRETGKL